MYKKILWLLCIFVCIGGVVSASIELIQFRFCEDIDRSIHLANKHVIAVTPWEEKEVCIIFNNVLDKTVQVNYWFSEGLLNEWGTQICQPDSWTGNMFSKFFVQTWDNIITLWSSEQKTVIIPIDVPVGVNGIQYWCFVYQLVEQAERWSMFWVVVRKIFPLNLLIWASENIKKTVELLKLSWWLYTTNKYIKMEINEDNESVVTIKIRNTGNITQKIDVWGKIYNFLWFEKPFSVSENKLMPWEEKEIAVNWWIIPAYRWFFTVKIDITHTPVFDFVISGMDEDIKTWWEFKEKATIYAFSWISVIVLILIIWFIIKTLQPRKIKKEIEHKNWIE